MGTARGSRMRHFEHGLLGILLAGALCSPLAAHVLQWPGADRIDMLDGLWIVMLLSATTAVTLLPVRQRGESVPAAAALRCAAILGTSIAIAYVLRYSANSFYTAPSLLDGMLALLLLHMVSRVMRWIAVEYRETVLVVHSMGAASSRTHHLRRLMVAAQRPRVDAFTLPAVALADTLASVSAWTLLAFWLLVALERRHVASAALVFAGTLLVLECAMLIPDTLAAVGLLPRGLQGRRDRSTT